jgi:predicted ester cyclase
MTDLSENHMTSDLIQHNKHLVWDFWQRIDAAGPAELPAIAATGLAEDVAWTGFHPFNELTGRAAVVDDWWRPLRAAFPDVRRDTTILLGGVFEGKAWVSATGCFIGTFAADWVGIPATGKTTSIRWGEFCAVRDGKIIEAYLLLDLVDVMRQAGYRVFPPAPGEDYWPRPFGEEGVLLAPQDDAESLRSLRLVEAMIGGLGKFDGADASKMGQMAFWTPDMHWYGPCGIGSSRDRKEYERNHQTPFLTAFPDRKGFTHPDGGRHKARIAEGNFVASTGWPSVRATHLGPYLGTPPTGVRVGMRVADWWRRKGDKLVQNWVFIDLPHLFLQMGVDLFARLREK